MLGRRAGRLALLPLLALLGGCGALSTPMGTGGPVVAGHLGYVKGYLEAGASEKARMVQDLESLSTADDPQSRLRYAIVLSLHDRDKESLTQSLAVLEQLQDTEGLTPAERWLARLWHGEVASRLELQRENADFRTALQQAEKKLNQLTLIEEELEEQDSGSGEK